MNKQWKLLAALAGLVLLAATVWGDNNVLNKGTYYQNATNGAKTDLNGNAYVTESAPSANNYSFQPSVISAVFSAAPEAYNQVGLYEKMDSTSVIDCRGYNRAALLMFPSATATSGDKGGGSGDSLCGGIFALQFRMHSGAFSDSQSTFIVPPGIGRSQAAGTQFSDSIGSIVSMIHNSNSLVGALPYRNRPNADEKLIVVGNIGNPTLTLGSHEARGMVIWTSRVGDGVIPMLPPFCSWRIRYLKSYTNVAGVPTAVADSIAAGAMGGLPMRVRCDLVLWRE